MPATVIISRTDAANIPPECLFFQRLIKGIFFFVFMCVSHVGPNLISDNRVTNYDQLNEFNASQGTNQWDLRQQSLHFVIYHFVREDVFMLRQRNNRKLSMIKSLIHLNCHWSSFRPTRCFAEISNQHSLTLIIWRHVHSILIDLYSATVFMYFLFSLFFFFYFSLHFISYCKMSNLLFQSYKKN